MGFLKKLFSPSPTNPDIEKVETYDDFWKWFNCRERDFHRVLKERGDVEKDLFDHVAPRLRGLNDGLFLLCGMLDKDTAELVITPDGDVRNIVFAEEIVAAAPKLEGWKFTALKPAAGEGFSLAKGETVIEAGNLFFCPNDHWERPDEVDISIVHKAVSEKDTDEMAHAIHLFLDNYLGELDFVTEIDHLDIVRIEDKTEGLRPLSDLKNYLQDRRRVFREKYEGQRTNTDIDTYSALEAQLENGLPLIAVVNTTLLMWDRKASHPWIAVIEFGYRGGENGLPNNETYEQLTSIEEEIMGELRDTDGYLNVGRQTADGVRTVFFACKDFRVPSKVFHAVRRKYSDGFLIDFGIYKDKYWKTFNRFIPTEGSDRPN